jgi:hypothetical protein
MVGEHVEQSVSPFDIHQRLASMEDGAVDTMYSILHAVGNAPFVVPPLGGLAADFRLKPVLRTCLVWSRVQYNAAGLDVHLKSIQAAVRNRRESGTLLREVRIHRWGFTNVSGP